MLAPLFLAAALEKGSEHPLAAAVVEGAGERGLAPANATDFQAVPGKGISGKVEGKGVLAGSRSWLEEQGVAVPENAGEVSWQESGGGLILVAIGGRFAGRLFVKDPVKRGAREAVDYFHAKGITLVMLTGDNRKTAQAVATELGIDRMEAEVLPDQKARVIQKLQAEGKVVAMAGDGINDSPALAQASVGIAMGTGADVALESAGITLVKGDLRGVVSAHLLSLATRRNIRQNLFFAFFYNTLGIPLAAGALYPFFGLLLSPMLASVAMSFSSVSVVANALRLNRLRL
jgi:Cu+-exporting ATPase